MIYDGGAGLLLSDRFTKVLTADLSEARPAIERLQGPFTATSRGTTSDCKQPVLVRAASCGRVAISTFSFGTTVDVVPNGLAGAILVTTAVRGKAGIAVRGNSCGVEAGSTFISQEEDSPTFRYEPDTEVIKLRFDRRCFEDFCFKTYHHLSEVPLHFHTLMTLPFADRRWTSLLRYLLSAVNDSGDHPLSNLETASMEELLMLTLLSIQPHNYTDGGHARERTVSPKQFRLAIDYIHESLESDITLADIAEASGCSIRSLIRVFHQSSNTSPMQYVHKLRLHRIKAELLNPGSDDKTIAEIAYQWGYRHLGDFNRKYRETFGETPSETRHRCSLVV